MKSRISKKFSWPHPIVKKNDAYLNYNNNYLSQLPPSTFQPFESSPQSTDKPCPHIFRPSTYILGSKPQINSNLQLGCIVSPFNTCDRNIPQYQFKSKSRCQNCNCFLNQNWILYRKQKLVCGLCQNAISFETQQQVLQNGNEGIRQITLQKSQNYVRKILFVIQSSTLVWNSEIFEHLVQNISILYEQNMQCPLQIGFIVFDQYIRLLSKGKKGCQIINIGDYYQTQLPVPMSQIFYDIDQRIYETFEILQQLMSPNQNRTRMKFNYYEVLQFLQHQIQGNTEVLLITSNYKLVVTSDLDVKAQRKLSDQIISLSDKFLSKNVSINLFSISKDKKPLQMIEPFLQKTGGQCYIYTVNRQYHPEDFYYDLYHYIHQKHYYNIQISVHTSKSLCCTQINNQIISQENKKLKLSKLAQTSTLNIYFSNQTKIQQAFISIQVKYKFRSQTKIKIINYEYLVSNSPSQVYSALGDQSLFYLILRKQLYSYNKNRPIVPIAKSLTSRFKSIVSMCKDALLSNSTFTIPNCLKHSIFYSETIVRSLQSNKQKHADYILGDCHYNWKCLSLERLSKKISMKLYRIDKESFMNIKYMYYNIDQDGIYAIDDGRNIFLYIGDNVSPAIIEDFISVGSKHVDIVSSSLNSFIESLRCQNHSYYLQLRLIRTQTKQVLLDGLHLQDAFKKYVKLLSQ